MAGTRQHGRGNSVVEERTNTHSGTPPPLTSTGTGAHARLRPRDRDILRDIIDAFITSGRPVSSRALSKSSTEHLSAATIRNVMADLEEAGLLAQPHTSAGRVPTSCAYRLYFEGLMPEASLAPGERQYIQEMLRDADDHGDNLVETAANLLSSLSKNAAVMLIPAVGDTVLKAIDFVPVAERRVLCVVVSSTGFVDNVVIEVEQPLPREALVRIANLVNDRCAGLTLRAIRDRLLVWMAEDRAEVDRYLAQAIDLARRAVEQSVAASVMVKGTSSLLDQPELADVMRIRRMLDAFSDKARLVALLNKCLSGDGVRLFVGEDSELTSELDFSLVATGYSDGRRAIGTLGILGPSRMEYARVVSLVHFLGSSLSETLHKASRS